MPTMEGFASVTRHLTLVFDVDMCNAQAVAKVFARNHFDGVIHFAGLKVRAHDCFWI